MRRIMLVVAVTTMGAGVAWAQGGAGKGCCGACCGAGGCAGAADVKAKPATSGTAVVDAAETDHDAIFTLLTQHDAVTRTVETLPNGVRTVTTTKDPKLVPVLRKHVRAMVARVEEERPIRLWDPVFQGIFANAKAIKIEPRDIDDGIEVLETSADPEVVTLIQAHAAKVDSFVAEGHAAARPPWAGRGRGGMGKGMGPGRGMGGGRGAGRGAGPPR